MSDGGKGMADTSYPSPWAMSSSESIGPHGVDRVGLLDVLKCFLVLTHFILIRTCELGTIFPTRKLRELTLETVLSTTVILSPG